MIKSKFAGMTVNERLCIAGLIDEFDNAVKSRNKSQIIETLKKTDLTKQQATETTEAILSNPKRYGF